MTKILIKKELLQAFCWLYKNKRNGKKREKKEIVYCLLLYLFVFGVLFAVFYKISALLCRPLVHIGYGWLYMALMGMTGVTMGVFGSVFNSFSGLYQAKDNDMLLAMPIPVRSILIARLSGIYSMGLLYELLVLLPALIVYFQCVTLTVSMFVFSVLIPFVLSFCVLSLSCVLGWIVAQIHARMKYRKQMTVLVSLVFIVAYMYLCGTMSEVLQSILIHPEALAEKVRGLAYPFYQIGLAAEGSWRAMLVAAGLLLGVFGVIYVILKRSFLSLVITNRQAEKTGYVAKTMRQKTMHGALLQKELRRFLQSPNYMLNCGLGIVFMIVAAGFLLVKQDMVQRMLQTTFAGYQSYITLLAAAGICMMASMNDISAPSISLEGKNIWLLQALPVSAWQILKAKLSFAIIMNMVPTVLLLVCADWVLRPAPLSAILMTTGVLLFVGMMAMVGLAANLKAPNLDWSSEIVPIKQSVSVMLTLFGGWIIILLLMGVYYLLRAYLSETTYFILVNGCLLGINVLLLRWLKQKGSLLFETLGNS